ncbi:MAG TPA: disulfide bond formation protein B [Egibacteraceae bacterium]|nr:disulfide bond formation protein B [Egibacteraceae bacterium]
MASVQVATRFFALLASACALFVVAAAALGLASAAGHERARRVRADVADALRAPAMALVAAIALVATGGSLYYSEIAGFPPCRLCWLQRGAMYPLAVAATAAAAAGAAGWRRPLRVLALAGAAVSAWHVAVERWPALEGAACDPANPCSVVWVRDLGVFGIPAMALAGFAAAAVLLSLRPPAHGGAS